MAKLYNLARMTVSGTPGTGNITLSAAVSGYLTFAQAGVADGDVIDYAVKDGANSEHGTAVVSGSSLVLARTVVKSTNSDALVSLTSAAEVFISPLASSLRRPHYLYQQAGIV